MDFSEVASGQKEVRWTEHFSRGRGGASPGGSFVLPLRLWITQGWGDLASRNMVSEAPR